MPPQETSPHRQSNNPLERRIEEARKRINGLKHNWDDDGALPVDPDTFSRAAQFVRRHASFKAAMPRISPCANGSLDIHWEGERLELLVNIPPHPAKGATFYGDTGDSKKGKTAAAAATSTAVLRKFNIASYTVSFPARRVSAGYTGQFEP